VASQVAEHLAAQLDIIVARKVGAPRQPELAMAAVTSRGDLFVNQDVVAALGISTDDFNAAAAAQVSEARRREETLRGPLPAVPIEGRTVIVVDDGMATGATTCAALRAARSQEPSSLLLAVPVGSRQACELAEAEADEVRCLYVPEPFYAVGFHYEIFDAVEDAEVRQILERAHARWIARRA
jgi:putative phosphoribosyl transferase